MNNAVTQIVADDFRFGRILLLISPLQTFTSASNTLESVFFQQSGIVNSMVAKCIKEYEDEY